MSLLTALKSGDRELVETVCASGASANELEDGASPMHVVVGLKGRNTKHLTKILLQYGGDPNVENEEKLTPVHVSVLRGNAKILQLLLRNGGDPNKKDEEGCDAWSYARKFAKVECERVLMDHQDEQVLIDSDPEQDKYCSIFHKDVPLPAPGSITYTNRQQDSQQYRQQDRQQHWQQDRQQYQQQDRRQDRQQDRQRDRQQDRQPVSSHSTATSTDSELTRFDESLKVQSAGRENVPVQGSRPKPPPRRRRSQQAFKEQPLRVTTECGYRSRSREEIHRHTTTSPQSLPPPAETKPKKNIFAVLKKSLSPGSKSSIPRHSPKSSWSSASSKQKSRSPLTSLLKSSGMQPRSGQPGSQSGPHAVRFDMRPEYTRSHSVPNFDNYIGTSTHRPQRSMSVHGRERLQTDVPTRAETPACPSTSPRRPNSFRKRLDLDTVDCGTQKYSPSNYNNSACKPEKEKRFGSPFVSRPRRRSLFKRMMSAPANVQETKADNTGVSIGIGQTLTLSTRNPTDSTSQLSVDVSSSLGAQHPPTRSNASTASPSNFVIDSREMAAIEAGRKVFDATSPDHCKVVAVDPEDTLLDDTIVYKSPPPKPRRLHLAQPFTAEHALEQQHSTSSTPTTSSYNSSPSTSKIPPPPPPPPVDGFPSPTRSPADPPARPPAGSPACPPVRSPACPPARTPADPPVRPPAGTLSRSKSCPSRSPAVGNQSPADLRGNLAAELAQQLKERQQRLADPKTEQLPITNGTLNHRWSSKGKSRLIKQGNVTRAVVERQPMDYLPTEDSRPEGDGETSQPPTPSSDDVILAQLVGECTPSDVRLTWKGNERQLVQSNGTGKPALKIGKSTDSGIDSTTAARRLTNASDSDDSFHTCQSDAAVPSNSNSVQSPELPTETDSLQSKMQRMNLEEVFTSDEESDQSDQLNESKYVTVLAASICASDGSIAEYLHTDLDTNVTLTEARWPITCTATNHSRRSIDWRTFSELSVCGEETTDAGPVTVSKDIAQLSDVCLLNELRDLGDVPGPITSATRRAYQLRLMKLRDNPQLCTPNKLCAFSRELQQFMSSDSSISLADIIQWEKELVEQFDKSSGRKWREGNNKMCFTYLLLDPRTTQNLPARHQLLDAEQEGEAFRVFLSSVFYIGKGKKTRPYQHFIDAIRQKNSSDKTKQIVDIWQSGLGVVSLHTFHNILAVEAYTREACMVDAIGLKNLTNIAKCNYYGVASTWNVRKKRLVGSNLLQKAYNMLLMEGERQLRPADVRDESELPSFLV